MANVSVQVNNRPVVWWVALVLGVILTGMSLVNLGAQVMYSARGASTSGKVVEFHQASARSATVNGLVQVALPDLPPFKWEVEDTFGTADWQDGGAVPLLCMRLHSDHMSCVLDSRVDRYGMPLLLLLVGLGLIWASVKMLRKPTASGSGVAVTSGHPRS